MKDLKTLSTDELINLKNEYKMLVETNDVLQYVTKILLNSSFGSTGMEINAFSNGKAFATAITTGGRLVNRLANHRLSEFLCKANNTEMIDGYDYQVQMDTDSVVFDTEININGLTTTIGDYYDSISDDNLIKNDIVNENFIKLVNNDMSPSVSKSLELQNNKVKHIMKHKVFKGFYTIKVNGNMVTVTEDHSIMVLRNDELISCTASEIIKGDKLITLNNITEIEISEDFEITYEGIKEEYVYDIEIENNHNFFGNNILVHNSGYIDISTLVKKKIEIDNKEYTLKDKYDLVNNISEKVLYPKIQNAIDDVAFMLNAYRPESWLMEQETLAEKFVSVADKRYFCRGLKKDKNGEIKPYFKITGLSLIGKSTPPYCKEKLEPVLDLILDKTSKDVVDYIEEIRKDFEKQPIETISVIKGVSSIDYDNKTFKIFKNNKFLTAPLHSRASIVHNNIIKERNLKYPLILAGDKVYYTYLTLPNPIMSDVIAYVNPKFMEEMGLNNYVDYNTMFEKNFKKSISLITDPINWSLDVYQDALSDWF